MELALRLAALALVAAALWLAVRPALETVSEERLDPAVLPDRLRDWVRRGAPDSVRLTLDSVPDDALLDWLVALRRAGTGVTWSGDVAPVALGVEPVNAPAGGMRLLLAAPSDTAVKLRDAAGPVETVRPVGSGAAVRIAALAEPAVAHLSQTTARAGAADSVVPGTLLVLGTAGWEARYAIAALEESGWRVEARLTIAPGLDIRRGVPRSIDTANYAAVIALDSAAAGEARRLQMYAVSGGGLILSGIAAAMPGLRDVAPGRPGTRVRPAVMQFTAGAPRRALSFVAIERLRGDALVLEARDGRNAVAARRAGIGRVLQIGYDESWRWRMQGGAQGMEAHRRWWSDAVAATARRTAVPRSSGVSPTAAAPRAALVSALGQPIDPTVAAAADTAQRRAEPWMLVLGLTLLLAEWASRRLRGAA
jgi:hypothetical protein